MMIKEDWQGRVTLSCISVPLLITLACTATWGHRSYQEERALRDQDGNVSGHQMTTEEEEKAKLEVDDRLWDVLPIPGGSEGSDEEGSGGGSSGADPAGPSTSAPDAEVHREAGSGAPFAPAREENTFETPGEGPVAPAPTELNIDQLQITLDASKTSIDQTDVLVFRLSWNTPLALPVRSLIAQTFEHADLPDPNTVAYAGPAPEGLDLAALLGVRTLELLTSGAMVVFNDPSEEKAWNQTEWLTTVISPQEGTVRVNGVVVMELSEDAQALDAIGPT